MTEYNNFKEEKESLKFSNVYEEIEFYKRKCEQMEKNLFQVQFSIKKLEQTLKKCQEINIKNAKNVNNTSIGFFLPSEFKSTWEILVKDLLLRAFDSFFEDYVWLSKISILTISLCYELTNIIILEKVEEIMKLLKINKPETNKIYTKVKYLFQEYSQFIFQDGNIKERLSEMLLNEITKYNGFNESILENLKYDLKTNDFGIFINDLFKICVYMHLHDPILKFYFNEDLNKVSYFYYDKSKYINIEGFTKENTPCAIILPPPCLKKGYPYSGLKESVYCISNPTQEILKECEANKKKDDDIYSKPLSIIKDKETKEIIQKEPKILNHISKTPLITKTRTFEKQYNEIKKFENDGKNNKLNIPLKLSRNIYLEKEKNENIENKSSDSTKDLKILAKMKHSHSRSSSFQEAFKIISKNSKNASILDKSNHDNETKIKKIMDPQNIERKKLLTPNLPLNMILRPKEKKASIKKDSIDSKRETKPKVFIEFSKPTSRGFIGDFSKNNESNSGNTSNRNNIQKSVLHTETNFNGAKRMNLLTKTTKINNNTKAAFLNAYIHHIKKDNSNIYTQVIQQSDTKKIKQMNL